MVNDFWGQFQKPSDFEEKTSKETPLQKTELKQEIEDKPQFQWGSFQSPQTYQGETDPTADESTFGYLVRNGVANASRVVESVFGKYGDIQETAKSVLTNYPQVTGLVGQAISEWVGPEKWERLIKGHPEQGFSTNLPTSQQLQEVSEKVTGGYTKPRTPGEEKFQAFTKDVASLASLRSGRIPTPRQAGIAGLATLGKEGTKELGFNEDNSTYAKMGIWTVLSLLDKVNAPRYAAEMTNQARRSFNPNLQANVPRLQQRLQAVANDPAMLANDPRTALARQQINQLNQNIANGQNSIESLLTAYDGVNAAKRTSGMFDLTRPSDRRFASRSLDRVLGALRAEIEDVGRANPGALREWQNGIGAWRAIHQSNNVSNWVQDLVKGPYAKLATSTAVPLFTGALYGAYQNPLVGLAAAGTAFGVNKLIQVGHRVLNDPVLADYYTRALAAAAQQDAPVFIKNFKKLNEELEKDKSIVGIMKPVSENKSSNTAEKK